jgi:transglutaminase-like putative cysteine protease
LLLASSALATPSLAPPALAEELPSWLELPAQASQADPAQASLAPDPALREGWLARGEGYVELLSRTQIRVERSGAIESRVEIVRHFLSETGVQQAGNLELSVDASRERLRIESAWSASPGAPPTHVAHDTLQVVDEPRTDIFSDWQRVVVPYAGLAPGSNAVLTATRRLRADEWPLPWSRLIFLAGVAPIARLEIRVLRESGAPPITWATDDPELRCEERSGGELLCHRDRVPAIQQDPDVASYPDLVPHFFVGVEESWVGLGTLVGDLVRSNGRPDSALRRQVAALLEGADTPLDRFRRLHRFVADEVRYVALSHGSWAVVPRPASVTLARRFGDCKDKVTLLVAMADLADLAVYPVLTSSARYRTERLLRPASSYFDHMVACAELGAGDPVCVDPTVAHAGLELPGELGGAVALALDPDRPARVTRLPQRDFAWDLESRRSLLLGCDGAVEERSERAFSGPASFRMRLQFLAWRSDERQHWASEEYRQAVSKDLRPGFAFDGLAEPEEPLRIRYETRVSGQYEPGSGLYLGFDPWLVWYMRAMVSQNRHHAHRMAGLRYVAQDVYEVCGSRIDLAGPTLRFESPFGSVLRGIERRAGRTIASTTVELPAAEIPVADLDEFERFVESALQETSVWLTWKPQGG